ncbi:methyltransferase [Chloroflexi bacterium TSY]|nr:methyltransferase [Chloroflexi bacterium TSY]
MPNPYFRFKQFVIYQDRCAMKVGTDGVLLGAWVSLAHAHQILDIGTGTGLIALMLAQRVAQYNCADSLLVARGNSSDSAARTGSSRRIDAIEIDEAAYEQACENVERSPWAEQIDVHHLSMQAYTNMCQRRYDLIVSNPPYFANSYQSRQASRNTARHSNQLEPTELLSAADRLLKVGGRLALIYPYEQMQAVLKQTQEHGLYCRRKLYVQPTPESPVKRLLVELEKRFSFVEPPPCHETTIALELARHVYTPEFIDLIRDFYVKY